MRVTNPQSLAAAFAFAVTEPSAEGSNWIAKNGPHSLFMTLARILPQMIQPSCKGQRFRFKGKMTCSEFNKVMQSQCGFISTRTRRRCLSSSAGTWLFSNRRWLDPSDPEDMSTLCNRYKDLCKAFSEYSQCPISKFLNVLDQTVSNWSECSLESPKKSRSQKYVKENPTFQSVARSTIDPQQQTISESGISMTQIVQAHRTTSPCFSERNLNHEHHFWLPYPTPKIDPIDASATKSATISISNLLNPCWAAPTAAQILRGQGPTQIDAATRNLEAFHSDMSGNLLGSASALVISPFSRWWDSAWVEPKRANDLP